MNPIDIVTVRLIWQKPWHGAPAPQMLRGALAQRFTDNSLFHQHEGDRCVYRYPSIQYRWDQHSAMLVGFGPGVRSLMELDWPGLELRLGDQLLTVLEAQCSLRRHTIAPSDRLIRYRFGAPWVPFRQEVYQRYQQMVPAEQESERDRLAVAGLLMAMRGLDVTFPSRLYAAFEIYDSCPCRYKEVELIGFLGTVVANVDVPEGFAIGRAVSHGYGWLQRVSVSPSRKDSVV